MVMQSSCRHSQAVEIRRVPGGPIYACQCVRCGKPLSPHWVAGQLRQAIVAAYCQHEHRTLPPEGWEQFCLDCGVKL